MSEYWKSTPNYWCKFCKTYVRDTKFEKQKHEATPKHQGNIQRSLRNLHRDNEREEREKQRAKDEVERLNGVVSGKPTKNNQGPLKSTSHVSAPSAPKAADPQERKRQLAQLADLGVAIPEEYRKEMAMAGEWQAVRIHRKKEEDEENSKPEVHSFGIRKRKIEDDDEDFENNHIATHTAPKTWGSRFKLYSEPVGEEDDLDALMSRDPVEEKQLPLSSADIKPVVKKEDSEENGDVKSEAANVDQGTANATIDKDEERSPSPIPVFKKRKTKIHTAT